MRTVGTVARGIRAPLIKSGDDIRKIVVESVLFAAKNEGFTFNDRDVIGVTEAIVARAQGNYASCEQISEDIRAKYPCGEIGLVFPILSRNRFAYILKGIAAACSKVYIMLSYPSDEVGNELVSWDMLDQAGINPYSDVLNEKEYREKFGYETKHPFTNIDYVEYYKSFGDNIEIVFANNPAEILRYTRHALCCDVHTRARTKRLLKNSGALTVFGLDDILSKPAGGSGYNPQYGVLGSNKATEDTLKLFPRDCAALVAGIQQDLIKATGKNIEVMVYGDGAFKDPVGKIWELADPVVSPGYTPGLEGTPNELKMKFLLDTALAGKGDEEKQAAIRQAIEAKSENLTDKAAGAGTTPRRYTDLLGSLCDLMSGSGDKGTPIILIQGYFDNYAS